MVRRTEKKERKSLEEMEKQRREEAEGKGMERGNLKKKPQNRRCGGRSRHKGKCLDKKKILKHPKLNYSGQESKRKRQE